MSKRLDQVAKKHINIKIFVHFLDFRPGFLTPQNWGLERSPAALVSIFGFSMSNCVGRSHREPLASLLDPFLGPKTTLGGRFFLENGHINIKFSNRFGR